MTAADYFARYCEDGRAVLRDARGLVIRSPAGIRWLVRMAPTTGQVRYLLCSENGHGIGHWLEPGECIDALRQPAVPKPRPVASAILAHLYQVERLTYREIADRYGLQPRTVEARLCRYLRRGSSICPGTPNADGRIIGS